MNLMELARSALAKRPDNDVLAMTITTQQQDSPATVADDPASDRRRQKVTAMLAADPNLRIALVVSDPDSDPVICTVGIRHVAVGELEIPHHSYNPEILLKLLDQHSVSMGMPP